MTRGRLAAAGTVLALAAWTSPATWAVADPVATPTAPRPTSTAASPQAPDPNPPLGGRGPDGAVPGGPRMLERGYVEPAGGPALPTGVTAAGWVLVDVDAGTVLAARDPHGRYQPASILKTLTALVLLPHLAGATAVPISEQAAATEGSAVGLAPGGAYTADILFTAMLLMSGNDATEALTEAAGGNAAVVAQMNATARAVGAFDTVVQTPTGLDGWTQLTSAYDLGLVLRAALAQPRLLAYDQTVRAFLPAQSVLKDGRPVGQIEMDNQSEDFLGGYQGAVLAKTGYTDAARHTFLCAATRGGHTLGVVMLRAERAPTDQWQQAASLLDWGFALPAGTTPVGTLDAPAATTPTAAPTAAPTGKPTAPTSTAQPPTQAPTRPSPSGSPERTQLAGAATRHGPGPVVYLGLVAVIVAAFGVVELRQRRRRRRR